MLYAPFFRLSLGLQRFTKALEVNDFTCAQEFDRLTHIGVVNQAQQVVISGARLLLCCDGVKTNNRAV